MQFNTLEINNKIYKDIFNALIREERFDAKGLEGKAKEVPI